MYLLPDLFAPFHLLVVVYNKKWASTHMFRSNKLNYFANSHHLAPHVRLGRRLAERQDLPYSQAVVTNKFTIFFMCIYSYPITFIRGFEARNSHIVRETGEYRLLAGWQTAQIDERKGRMGIGKQLTISATVINLFLFFSSFSFF